MGLCGVTAQFKYKHAPQLHFLSANCESYDSGSGQVLKSSCRLSPVPVSRIGAKSSWVAHHDLNLGFLVLRATIVTPAVARRQHRCHTTTYHIYLTSSLLFCLAEQQMLHQKTLALL